MRASAMSEVISSAGRRAIWVTALLRLATGIGVASAIVGIGRQWSGADGIGLTISAIVIAAAATFAEYTVGGAGARREERRVRRMLLQRHFATGFPMFPPARLIQMTTDGTERLTNFTHLYWGSTLAALVLPMAILGYITIAIDPIVGGTVLALVPVIPVAVFGFLCALRRTSAKSRRQRAALAARYLDAIRNLTTISLMGAGERITKELREIGEKNRRAIMRLLAGNQLVIIVLDGVFSLVLICATAAMTAVRADHLSTADALTIIALTIVLLEPLQQVAGFFYIGMGGMAAAREIRTYLRAAPPRAAMPVSPRVSDAAIEISNVCHSYDREPVLTDISLTIAPGSRIAIVGASGAGKSTLLRLLAGALPLQRGQIQIESAVGRELRTRSAVVGQSTWLFTGTIAQNLRLAAPNASDAQLWEALSSAQVADEIARMPQGLDTYLGEGASLVSGGQAQRLALARALLSGRRVLLLDEPTSHVDLESERAIIEAIAALPSDLTGVMATHREALVQLADTIVTLKDGRLTQRMVARG